MKRKPELPCDARLQHVMRALDSVTRDGDLFASGASEQFPCPAIAFKGDEEEELLFPLRRNDMQKIKARASVCETMANAGTQDAQKVWEVDGEAIESHNWRWREFLDERVTSMRAKLGIAPTAVVNASLMKLMPVEAGGSLCVRQGGEERDAGVFGTLLVVLPGAFEGGDCVVQQREGGGGDRVRVEKDGDGTETDGVFHSKTMTWQPSARGSPYDLTYAVFYDHCAIVAEPVTSGTACCLVYDLVTTTPGDIPLYAGSKRLQQFVDTALNDFFDVVPEPLVKRCKISDDAWRTVNAFVVERQFVHIVYNDTFENLEEGETKIMKSLASFCAQSGGQYVLYLAGAVYSQYAEHHSSWSDGGIPDEHITLKAPWIRYGDLEESACPPIFLDSHREVAPLDHMDMIGAWDDLNDADATVKTIVRKLHGKESNANAAWANALVVLPTSIEARQIAKLSLEDANSKLRGLLAESRDEALRYVRRVVHYRARWELCSDDMAKFAEFVKIVVELNDPRLFNDVLLAVDLKCVDEHGALLSAVQHFGWHMCVDSVVKCILLSSTFSSRVNLVISSSRASEPIKLIQCSKLSSRCIRGPTSRLIPRKHSMQIRAKCRSKTTSSSSPLHSHRPLRK